MVYFDEEALKNHNRDRSLLKSMFNFYSINFAKITPTFLILKIHLNFENIYPVYLFFYLVHISSNVSRVKEKRISMNWHNFYRLCIIALSISSASRRRVSMITKLINSCRNQQENRAC